MIGTSGEIARDDGGEQRRVVAVERENQARAPRPMPARSSTDGVEHVADDVDVRAGCALDDAHFFAGIA